MGLVERWNALSSTRWQTSAPEAPNSSPGVLHFEGRSCAYDDWFWHGSKPDWHTRRSRTTSLCVMKSEGGRQRVPTSCHLPFKCYSALVWFIGRRRALQLPAKQEDLRSVPRKQSHKP